MTIVHLRHNLTFFAFLFQQTGKLHRIFEVSE